MRYQAILFDLFNTVAIWHPERMPTMTLGGRSRASTLPELRRVIAASAPGLAFDDFHAALEHTNRELAAERAREGREIASRERFRRALERAGLDAGAGVPELAEALSLRHMELLAGASDIPRAHLAFLSQLSADYRLALVSNFDHAPTAHAIVARDGASELFEHVVISDEFGWRKPNPRIFEHTLDALGITAREALFVGDSIDDDVRGAHAAGLDVAWVNARGEALPADAPRPDCVVASITELAAVLA